jgi:hypothetical protein
MVAGSISMPSRTNAGGAGTSSVSSIGVFRMSPALQRNSITLDKAHYPT